MAHLALVHITEEVGLVFDEVGCHQELRPSCVLAYVMLRVMPRGDGREVTAHILMKHAEFDAAVAHNVGVWGSSAL